MQITREEAMRGLVDFARIDHVVLERVTPLAAPLFLEVGKVSVSGAAEERLLAEEEARLMETSGLARIN